MFRIIVGFACIGLSVPAVTQSDPYFLPSDRVAVRRMDAVPPIDLAPGVHVRTVVGATGSFSIGDFDSGSAAVLHHHTREQADVGITGVLEMTLGTHVESLGPGAGVIVPPDVAHSIANRGGGVMTVIEFHTVRRPDLVPPRPALTFPASPEPVAVPVGHALVTQLDGPGSTSSAGPSTIRGQTCTLVWRQLPTGATPTDMHPTGTRTELFVYVVRGVAELATSGGVQRVMAGTLIVIPSGERHVSL